MKTNIFKGLLLASTLIFCYYLVPLTSYAVAPSATLSIAEAMPATPCPAVNADDILGKWLAPKKDGKIFFYKQDGYYYGRVTDRVNPNDGVNVTDPVVFKKLSFNGKDGWEGSACDPRSGIKCRCKIWLENSNTVMKIHGYMGFYFLGKTETMTKSN